MTCCIAGIYFEFCNLKAEEFNQNFLPFMLSSAEILACRERCIVQVVGASPDLRRRNSQRAWSFEEQNGFATLTGANPEGELLWRMTGTRPYDQMTFEWNPDTYFEMYENAYHGPYGIIVILALVMRLLYLKGIVFHSAAAVINGSGIICTGRSGQGKSTISTLLNTAGIDVLTDERPIIRVEEAGLRVYGSPWPSSGAFVMNSSAVLKKIYFIEHGLKNEALTLTKSAALLRLLDVVMVPWMNASFFDPVIGVLEKIAGDIPNSLLRFVPDASVAEFIRRDLGR
ncbi:MAG: hypothetical protein WC340_12565 [Kiritimatiellia bacterium]